MTIEEANWQRAADLLAGANRTFEGSRIATVDTQTGTASTTIRHLGRGVVKQVLDLLGGSPDPATGAVQGVGILPDVPDQLAVMGCSAGSMGAQLAAPLLYQWAKAVGVGSLSLVADSFIGAFEQTSTL